MPEPTTTATAKKDAHDVPPLQQQGNAQPIVIQNMPSRQALIKAAQSTGQLPETSVKEGGGVKEADRKASPSEQVKNSYDVQGKQVREPREYQNWNAVGKGHGDREGDQTKVGEDGKPKVKNASQGAPKVAEANLEGIKTKSTNEGNGAYHESTPAARPLSTPDFLPRKVPRMTQQTTAVVEHDRRYPTKPERANVDTRERLRVTAAVVVEPLHAVRTCRRVDDHKRERPGADEVLDDLLGRRGLRFEVEDLLEFLVGGAHLA